ncbi:inosine triphosphate pyrophosphatase-like protein [Mortierella sp. GBAus27b]|nr:hypothetical protein BGX31_008617 [Mortierella sp. GBA43]KAI8362123.1 inosine triphosphate pyrophosphatase-like protein [Mortierella sp. GBAus27b]
MATQQILNIGWLNALNAKKVVLASSSPRRKDILTNMGLKYVVVPSTFPETLDKSLFPHPSDYVKENAYQKALEVYERLKAANDTPDLIIGADTVVAHNSEILEKPASELDAVRMLKSLSGSSHMVYTGVTLIAPPLDGSDKPRVLIDVEGTEVNFQTLTEELIKAYVDTKEPMDKAGAYGYQTMGSLLVKSINGCSWNVIGLPASKVFFMIQDFTK